MKNLCKGNSLKIKYEIEKKQIALIYHFKIKKTLLTFVF
jgi:hypothetical protein